MVEVLDGDLLQEFHVADEDVGMGSTVQDPEPVDVKIYSVHLGSGYLRAIH